MSNPNSIKGSWETTEPDIVIGSGTLHRFREEIVGGLAVMMVEQLLEKPKVEESVYEEKL